MSKNRDEEKKKHLVHEKNVNKRPPLWAYQKTKDRSLMRERKRYWRRSKLGKKLKNKAGKQKRKHGGRMTHKTRDRIYR